MQPADDAILAKQKHDDKERGRHALAGERHARAIDEHSRLYAFLFGEGAEQLLGGGLGEFGCCAVASTQLDEQVAGTGVLQELRDCRGIEGEYVTKVRTE